MSSKSKSSLLKKISSPDPDLIINLAIGGEWGGIQGIDNSIFPASFVIDYVRLYIKE